MLTGAVDIMQFIPIKPKKSLLFTFLLLQNTANISNMETYERFQYKILSSADIPHYFSNKSIYLDFGGKKCEAGDHIITQNVLRTA